MGGDFNAVSEPAAILVGPVSGRHAYCDQMSSDFNAVGAVPVVSDGLAIDYGLLDVLRMVTIPSECERSGTSPKRNHEGESVPIPSGSQVEILELRDLDKEYILARSRLTMAKHNNAAAVIVHASAEDMVPLLVQAGLFDAAISLCQTFKLSFIPVFEGLTYKCITLQNGGDATQADGWKWLAENQQSSVVTTKESSATDEALRLLTFYLEKYHSQNLQYHRCVIDKLLSHGVPLPSWLTIFYKKEDAAQLLRLYLKYDLLAEAAELVLEYVDAVMGKGHESFGIERPLSAVSPLVWLPYTPIDHLLKALRENSNSQLNKDLLENLTDKLEKYFAVLGSTTAHFLSLHRT